MNKSFVSEDPLYYYITVEKELYVFLLYNTYIYNNTEPCFKKHRQMLK